MGVESLELRVSGEFSVESLEIVVKLFSCSVGTEDGGFWIRKLEGIDRS